MGYSIQGVFEFEAFLVTGGLYIIRKNFNPNLLSKMFVLTEIIACMYIFIVF
jgi:hypothetical protein